MVFKDLYILVLWMKVASALEGLKYCRSDISQKMTFQSRNLQYTLSMLMLLLSKAQERRKFGKPFKPCFVGMHWI